MAFGGREFEEDPFFRDTRAPSGFHNGLPHGFHSGLPHGFHSGLPHGFHSAPQLSLMRRDPFNAMAMWPFGGMNPFGRMDTMFRNMEQQVAQAHQPSNPNVHSFSSCTVMSYSSHGGEGGRPSVYQASSSTLQAPRGIRETRKSVRDSESGVQKMSVGHHIGERSHTIEKQYNTKTNEKEESQHFINLDEDEADSFNTEWRQKTHHATSHLEPLTSSRPHHPGGQRRHLAETRGLPAVGRPSVDPQPSRSNPHIHGKRKHRSPSLSNEEEQEEQSKDGTQQYRHAKVPLPADHLPSQSHHHPQRGSTRPVGRDQPRYRQGERSTDVRHDTNKSRKVTFQ